MRTPMQEMLEYVQDEVQLFGSARQILISKIKEMLEKEKEVMCEFGLYCTSNGSLHEIDYVFNETFNAIEK